MNTMEKEMEWFSLKQAAKYLGVSINTLKAIMSLKRDFPVVRFSQRLYRVSKFELDNWLVAYGRDQVIEEENPKDPLAKPTSS